MRPLLRELRAAVADGKLDRAYIAVRLETCGDVLDQAELLLNKGHLVAATVLAGGALETHLNSLRSGDFTRGYSDNIAIWPRFGLTSPHFA